MNSNQPISKVEVLLKAADVAQRLNICKSMAYLLMKANAIPTVRIGSAIRVRPKDLEAYIEKCRTVDEETHDSYHGDSSIQPGE